MNNTQRSPVLSRRELLRTATGFGIAAGVLAACSAPSSAPNLRIVYPQPGVRVPEDPVPFQIAVRNFNLVQAYQGPRPGEGHVHYFIDVPADSIADGALTPFDQPAKYVHAGKAPFNTRSLNLTPGVHTVTAVMADSAHLKLPTPAPTSVTFFVQPGGIQTK